MGLSIIRACLIELLLPKWLEPGVKRCLVEIVGAFASEFVG